jgi:UDP-N-acetylenolpyruvoylglucosamine reductase
MGDQPQGEQRQIQLRIDESKMQTTYANTIRTSTTADEVVLDFGMNLPVAGPDNQPMLVFGVGSRVVMNWQGAKRLAISLGQVVRQHEERNGEISLGQRQQGGPRITQ